MSCSRYAIAMRSPTYTAGTIALFTALTAVLSGCGSDSKPSVANNQVPCGAQQTRCSAALDADSSEPYCTNTLTDISNCGSCGHACGQREACSAGQCSTACQPSETLCAANATDAGSAYCANTLTDSANCGLCGNQCGQGTLCSNGQCINPCQPGETLCSTATDTDAGGAPACANLQNDNANCGCCGNACSPGQGCRNGRCDTATSFSFFIFGDMHMGPPTSNANVQIAMNQMNQIDPGAIAAISNGDLVDDAIGAGNWNLHNSAIAAAPDFHPDTACAASFGSLTRYFAAVGNHDVMGGNWFNLWNQHLTGQQGLGHDATDGIYYSLTYANTLFIMLDSEHVSSAQTSWSDDQTKWLASVLASPDAQNAQLKFIFFHEPVYACSVYDGFAAGLPWVDLAEKNKVSVIFGSHTHVYTRTCPKIGGQCTSDGTGVVFVETGAVGGALRPIAATTAPVVGTDSAGNARTDTYNCSVGLDMMKTSEMNNDFCHVKVDGCLATVNCYIVTDGNTTPFDTWTVNGC